MLAEAHRILRPNGRFAIHVHNFWLNLRNPQGRTWLCEQCAGLFSIGAIWETAA